MLLAREDCAGGFAFELGEIGKRGFETGDKKRREPPQQQLVIGRLAA
jgi:hypothetical protein